MTEKRYTIILDDTENKENVPAKVVIAYALNRIAANTESFSGLDFGYNHAEEILQELMGKYPNIKVPADKDAQEFLSDTSVLSGEQIESLEKIILSTEITIAESISIVESMNYKESIELYTGDYKFNFLETVSYSFIEDGIEQINAGTCEDDFEERLSMESYGEEGVGARLFILRSGDSADPIATFILSGSTSNGYILRCVSVAAKYSSDSQDHS